MCITIVKPTKIIEHKKLMEEQVELAKTISAVYRAKWYWEEIKSLTLKAMLRNEAVEMIKHIDKELYMLHIKEVVLNEKIKECEVSIG